MSARKSRLLKVGALVPLAAVSVAWTAGIAGVGGPALVSAERPQAPAPAALPDGTALPSEAIEAPASVTGDAGSLGIGSADASQVVSTASASGIPSAALAAYQRAETVINSADTTCRLPWQLVAAIGRVESNHGRANGNVLDDDGLATPGIFGVPLDGTNATQAIADTDAGQYDQDTTVDRAVGPMQFIPSTWSVVGVDADGDGQRNPQDINDAALGAAVYLCSGADDLSTDAGQRASVYRYNHSDSYVDLVLSVMQAYMSGDFTTIPNSAVAAGVLVPQPGPIGGAPSSTDRLGGKTGNKKAKNDKKAEPTPTPTRTPQPTPTPTADPGRDGDDTGKGGQDKGGDKGDKGGKKGGVQVQVPGGPTATVPALPTTGATPVDQVLTLAQATAQCLLEGKIDNPLAGNDPFDQCVEDYTTAP